MTPVTDRPTIDLLARVPLFEDLPRSYLGRLAALATESRFEAGGVIVKKDDPGRAFFVIVEGSARVVTGSSANARTRAELHPGDFFGELSLLDGETRTATVVATTVLRTIRIERAAFRHLVRDEPNLALKMLEGMARRTRKILDSPPV
jgi:CRP/FNR family transcriptional regulator/CRP/FNR family cyclic AMP-dependent transcriptional regulator